MAKFIYLTSIDGKVVRVKVGFCWFAALFGPLWAMVKRSWRLAFLLALSFSGLVFFDEAFVKDSRNLWLLIPMLLGYISFIVVCGKYGNAWLVSELLRKGYSAGPEYDA